MSEANYMFESQMSEWADYEDMIERGDAYFNKLITQYNNNKKAAIGSKIKCACCCGKTLIKKSYQSQFYSNKGAGNCKDKYWNNVGRNRIGSN